MPEAKENTDRELFREDTGDPAGSYYETREEAGAGQEEHDALVRAIGEHLDVEAGLKAIVDPEDDRG